MCLCAYHINMCVLCFWCWCCCSQFVIIFCPSQRAVMKNRPPAMYVDGKAPGGDMAVMTESGGMNVIRHATVIIGTIAILITAVLAGAVGTTTIATAKTPKNVAEIIIIIIGNKSAIF